MSELDDPSLEMLLRDHLSGELDGQLGRSVAAFLNHAGSAERAGNRLPGDVAPPLPLADAPALVLRPSRSARFGGFGGRFNGWFIGLAGAALAASIAALWAAPAAFRGGAPVIPVRTVRPADPDRRDTSIAKAEAPGAPAPTDLAEWMPSAPSPQQPALHWVQSRTLDEGTVVLDDRDHPVPARKLRQQQWEHTQWYDPSQRARVETTVPHENVKFVEMDTY